MEQINYQEEYKRLFSADLANSPVGGSKAIELQSIKILLDKFPFCQSLHFIYAAGLKNDPEKFGIHLPKAAIHDPQHETLYQTIQYLGKFILKNDLVSELQNGVGIQEEIIEKIIPDILTDNIPGLPEIDIIPEKDITEAEILGPDNIASADYFTFAPKESLRDKSVADLLKQTERAELHKEDITSSSRKIILSPPGNPDTLKLAKYHDDKLPYTFLWWLNKTRKEHNETYQPYVNFKLDTTRPIRRNVSDELNQQIIQNIFHLEPALGDKERKAPSNTVEFELKRKEEDIIEKFIKEDPQIRPMLPEKISTENKARKSAEDLYDLVSETLARIYTDQMLFHKAIDTYKKLSLKFPEKNAYFADQISELEKRIN